MASVLGQSMDSIELIAIDDASPGRCPKVLDEWASRDTRMCVVHRTENGRAGIARRQGLEIASGEYILFADADDRLLPEMCERLANLADETSADIALGGWITVDEKGEEKSRVLQNDTRLDLRNDRHKARAYRLLNFALWNKVFRRSIIQNMKFKQYEANIGEDTLFNIEAVCRSRKMVVTSYAGYEYTEHESSATGQSQKGIKYLRTLMESQQHINEVLSTVDGSRVATRFGDLTALSRFALGCEWIAQNSDQTERRNMWLFWQEYWNDTLRHNVKTHLLLRIGFQVAMQLNRRPDVFKNLRRLISLSKKLGWS